MVSRTILVTRGTRADRSIPNSHVKGLAQLAGTPGTVSSGKRLSLISFSPGIVMVEYRVVYVVFPERNSRINNSDNQGGFIAFLVFYFCLCLPEAVWGLGHNFIAQINTVRWITEMLFYC